MPKPFALVNVHVERMTENTRAVGWEIGEYRYHYWTVGVGQLPHERAMQSNGHFSMRKSTPNGTIYRNPINPKPSRRSPTAYLDAGAKDNARMVAQVLNELGQAGWLQAEIKYAERLEREKAEQHAAQAESIKQDHGPALYDAVSLILEEFDGAVRAMRIGGDLVISGTSTALRHLRKVHKEIVTQITDDLVSRG